MKFKTTMIGLIGFAVLGWLSIPGIGWDRDHLEAVLTAEAEASEPPEAPEWTQYELIAHGLGGISGYAVTNSYEAFVANYEKGHRLFEVDLILTSDEKLAARHDWHYYSSEELQPTLPEESKEGPIPFKEFVSHPILEKYNPIGIKKIVELLQKYPDVYFVTDTKETDPGLVRIQFEQIVQTAKKTDPALLDRIIPELYTEEMIRIVRDIHPFKHLFFSLYLSNYSLQETVDIIRDYDVKAVAMPTERATPELVQAIRGAGAVVYAHTVNDIGELNALRAVGVNGFYTDFLTYTDFELAELRSATAAKSAETLQAQAQQQSGSGETAAQPEDKPGLIKSAVKGIVNRIRAFF